MKLQLEIACANISRLYSEVIVADIFWNYNQLSPYFYGPCYYHGWGSYHGSQWRSDNYDRDDFTEADGPGKQEGDFKVENDKQDGYQIEADVELVAGIRERFKAAFVSRGFLDVGMLRNDDHGCADGDARDDDSYP